MVTSKKRKVKIPIRKWLAELFGVHSESVSRWIGHGHLKSYSPEIGRASCRERV